MPFTAMSDSLGTCGGYAYEIVDVTGNFSTLGYFSGDNVGAHPVNNNFSELGTYTFKIKGIVSNYSASKFITSAETFTVNIVNPCISS